MKKKYVAIALLLCSSLAFSGCGKEAAPVSAGEKEEPGLPVEIMSVDTSTIENQYTYNGKVKPINEVNVLSLISGKVATVNFDVGDRVNKGDVLFTMDTSDITNQMNVLRGSLQSVEANISSAQTTLDLVNGASMQAQIDAAKAALDNAEIAYNNAKTAYENNKTLYESNVISKAVFDEIESGYKRAEVSYSQAQSSYDITANQMPEENLKRAQEGLKVAQASKASLNAQLASAEKQLRDAVVTSPISGLVTACNVKPATMLSQGQTVPFTIIDTSSVDIDVNVSEQIINSLQPSQEVDVKIATVSDTNLKGLIRTINPAASANGTYEVKVEIPNPDNTLKSGMFGEVFFTREKSDNTVVLPRNAVITKNGEDYVFIEENAVAKKVVVTLGVDNGDEIEVKSGIEVNMNVIIKGQTYLEDGDKVEISTNQDSPASDKVTEPVDTPDSTDASDSKEE